MFKIIIKHYNSKFNVVKFNKMQINYTERIIWIKVLRQVLDMVIIDEYYTHNKCYKILLYY